jgi:hypothetical protein
MRRPLGGGDRGAGDAALDRSADERGAGDFLPDSDEAPLQRQRARSEAPASKAPRWSPSASPARCAAWAVRSTLVTVGDNLQRLPNHGDHLRQALRSGHAHAQPDPGHVGGARGDRGPAVQGAPASTCPRSPCFSGGFTFEVMYEMTGPDLDQVIELSEKAYAELQATPGIVDADLELHRGKPEVRAIIDRERPPTWASRSPTWPTCCASSSAARGELVPGRRRGVRHPHAGRAGPQRADVERAGPGHRALDQAGVVPLTDVVKLEEADRSVTDRSLQAPPQGRAHGQHRPRPLRGRGGRRLHGAHGVDRAAAPATP